jgi:hypothetical protein
MSDLNTKVCLSCKQQKPMSEFYLTHRNDYTHKCLTCRTAEANGIPLSDLMKQEDKALNQGSRSNGRSSSDQVMTNEQAMLELTLINAELTDQDFDDVVVEGLQSGIPPELLTRMKELWEQTKNIAGEVIEVGKIVVMKIIDFIRAHPKLGKSLALGAAVYFISHAIPIVGPLLAPLLASVTTIYSLWNRASFDEVVNMAKDFFALIVNIFNAVAERWIVAA